MTHQARTAWVFVTPALAAVALFLVLPTAAAVLLSLTDFDIYALADLRNLRFTGGATFAGLLSTPVFWRALGVTLVFAGAGVPATLAASLATALLLDAAAVRARGMWRVIVFAPYVTSVVATAMVWRYLLDTRFGLLNRALHLLGAPGVDWLGDPRTSIPAVLIFVTWKLYGYNVVVFTAALAAVPQDLSEAARVDGAGAWTRLRHVVLPAIGPILLLTGLVSVAGFLQIFDEPYIMTQGGPSQSTTTLMYFMFTEGFEGWDLARASAVAVVLFALTLVVTRVQVMVGKRVEWV